MKRRAKRKRELDPGNDIYWQIRWENIKKNMKKRKPKNEPQ